MIANIDESKLRSRQNEHGGNRVLVALQHSVVVNDSCMLYVQIVTMRLIDDQYTQKLSCILYDKS